MTVIVQAGVEANGRLKISGNSTETKPIGSYNGHVVADMSTFFEKDTQDYYFYDADRVVWVKFGG